MTKAWLFYLVVLWLLGESVKSLIDAYEKKGFERGDRNGYERWLTGYHTGYAAKARHDNESAIESDVHRKS